MGGRGARSASNIKSGQLDIKQLDIKQKSLEKQKKMLEDKMIEYAHYTLPSYTGKDKEAKSKKYYKLKNNLDQTKKQLNEILDKKAETKRKLNKKNNKTNEKIFVNSYGEATKRTITSAAYERAQRRIDRDILRNMGM